MIPLLEPAIGICRFSFCGKGDWRAAREAKTPNEIMSMRAEVSAELYAPSRMELRFFLFENFLLPSLRSQTDRNFVCLILTSDIMPAVYLERLRDLCADDANLELLVSSELTVHQAIWPRLSALNTLAGRPLINFRIDDDDCLSHDYIKELRGFMTRLGDRVPLSYSRSNGLVVTNYLADKEMFIYKANLPFNSMGTAIRVHGERTIFSFGHYGLHKRFPAIVDNSGMGYISIKLDGHDSRPVSMTTPHIKTSHVLICHDEVEGILSRWFSFIGDDTSSRYEVLMRKLDKAVSLATKSESNGVDIPTIEK